jgi:hypothetical protein
LIRSSQPRPATEPGNSAAPGRDEHLVLDRGPVDVRVRADQDGVAERRGVPGPAADQRVLHDDHIGAEPDRAVLRGEHGAVQDPGPLTQDDRTAHRRRRRDVRGFGDDGPLTTVFEDHRVTVGGPARRHPGPRDRLR